MRRFAGRGGKVFAVGDPYTFVDVPLLDTGNGWDYVAPDGLGCWDASPLMFEVQDDNGGWEKVVPVEVHERTGRVGFARCYSGRWVRVSGVCHPTAFMGWGSEWRLDVLTSASAAPVLGSDDLVSKVRITDVVATVNGVVAQPVERVFVMLPFASGVYVGFGELHQAPGGVKILFDDEGVVYEPCNN